MKWPAGQRSWETTKPVLNWVLKRVPDLNVARSPGRRQSSRGPGEGGSPSSAADLLCALPLSEFYLSNESGPFHPRHSGVLLWLVLLPSKGKLPTRRIVLESYQSQERPIQASEQSESKSQEPEADPLPHPQQKTSELLEPSQHFRLCSVPRIPP